MHLRELLHNASLEIVCIDETKLDTSFPDKQFEIKDYQFPPYRRDRNSNGGGKMVFVKQGIINKRLHHLETIITETICIEIIIAKTKWCVLFVYRPPDPHNQGTFFSELTNCLTKIVNLYDYFMVIGDINIEYYAKNGQNSCNYLSDLCDTFSLYNLIKGKTCFKSVSGSSIDVMLTNRRKMFMKSTTITTGLSDHHQLILSCFRSKFTKLPPKYIYYREYKKFNENNFLRELDRNLLNGNMFDGNTYSKLTRIFASTLQKHAPLKMKMIRGNHGLFMNKELSKLIMTKSRLRNKYLKWPSRENFLNFRKVKNKCNNLSKKVKKDHLNKVTQKGFASNKDFWNTVKPFLTNKCGINHDKIIIENNQKLITDEKEIAEVFNDFYINIIERTSGNAPVSTGSPENPNNDRLTVSSIIDKYKDHSSVLEIRKRNTNLGNFTLPKAEVQEVNTIIKSLNSKKATGPDGIPIKIVKLSANVIDTYVTHIINSDLTSASFSEEAKIASVRPIFKKKSRTNIENYRPVSILNAFSKVYEKYIHEKLIPFTNKFLSKFISAYRKTYSSNHVLIRLIENWKKALDLKYFTGAVLMDLSKAFDCIPHDLLIAKMHAYGFDESSLVFFYSYLKRRKQSVKVNNAHSKPKWLISGVPQGSTLGTIFFNVFINDIIYWLEELYNFADDNTISAFNSNLTELIKNLEKDSEIAINWFKSNEMLVNAEKFQAIILKKHGNTEEPIKLKIDNKEIETEKNVKLLGVTIDEKLNFDEHVSFLCKKAAAQLNAISRIKYNLGQKEKEAILNSFIFSNFNYCPLVWHFCSAKSMQKIEKIQERSLRILLNDNNSTYRALLTKTSKSTMEVKRLRTLALEIFRTINDMNPEFMKDIFIKNQKSRSNPNNLKVHYHRTTKYGDRTLKTLGPKIWNMLPTKMKNETSFQKFKEYINTWFGPKCKCNLCLAKCKPGLTLKHASLILFLVYIYCFYFII